MENLVDDLLFKEESFKIVGLCMKVHGKLGKGFKEIVYKDALEFEMKSNGIPYEREKSFPILYSGIILPHRFEVDFLAYDSIVLEIKAAYQIHYEHLRQTLNYLKSSRIKLGILFNFGEDNLMFKRVVCSRDC